MTQVEIDLPVARKRAAELVDIGHRGAGQGQPDHQRAAGQPGEGGAQTRQHGPQQTHGAGREQHDPLHEQRRQRQPHPVKARLHRLGQHQHEHQQLGEQDQAKQGIGLAQLGDEEVIGYGSGFHALQPVVYLPGSFLAHPVNGKPGAGQPSGIIRNCQPAHPSPP